MGLLQKNSKSTPKLIQFNLAQLAEAIEYNDFIIADG